MPKLDLNLYGADDNGFAQSIASDALKAKGGTEDIWGSLKQDKAEAKGNGTDPSEVVVVSDKSDSRTKSKGN